MKITKNGFYNLKGVSASEIYIDDNINAILFDEEDILKKIELGNHAKLEYFSFFSNEGVYNKHIMLKKIGASCTLNSLIFSEANTVDTKITGQLSANETNANMNILSFAGNDGNIKLDGILQIDHGTKKVGGCLNEENIFLGDSARISGFPTLLVETNDVDASHSCKMEKINDEKLFYLRSRGVDKKNALSMMIEAKIRHLFEKLELHDVEFYSTFLTKVLGKIK